MLTQADEETLTALYAQRQEILRNLADVDTNIKLLETQLQEKVSATTKLATEELTNGGNTETDKVRQLIYRCMRDANGLKDALKVTEACRHIQQKLKSNDPENLPRLHFRNVFVHEVIAHAQQLSTDANGCDFMQHVVQLMKNGQVPATLRELDYDVNPATDDDGPSPVSELMLLIEVLGDSLVPIACNTSGARVSQRIVDGLSTVEEFTMLARAISPESYIELAKDINGNHTLSKLISSNALNTLAAEAKGDPELETTMSAINALIFEPVMNNCIDICKNRQGCCIIQKCLQSAPEPYYTTLIDTVLGNSLKLVQDPFGNYVVQFILDRHQELGANRGVPREEGTATGYTNQIIRQMLHHVAELSCNKFSSNVVEKCLKTASPDVRQLLVDELTDPKALPKLLTDSFANYVIQTAIVTASDDGQFAQLRDSIMPLQNLLKNSPHGVKIEAKLSRRHRETTRKQTKKKEAAAAAAAATASSSNTPVVAPVQQQQQQQQQQQLPPPPPPPPPHGMRSSASQDSFFGSAPVMQGIPQSVPTFVPQNNAGIGGPMAFTNLPPDFLFQQQQMLGSMPFVLQGGHQPVIGLQNNQPQFMNLNMGMNVNGGTGAANISGPVYQQ